MPNPIKPKRSYTPSSVPLATDLQTNEMAVNWNDGKVFTKDGAGNIVTWTLGSGGGGGGGTSWVSVPASPTATGTAGQQAYDGSHYYICTATNTWRRIAFTSWSLDPYIASVSLLLHMDGTGSTFVDSSPTPKTLTAVGSVTQSAAQSRWGGKSGYFDGSGTRLAIPDSDAFAFAAGDYTVEAWLYVPSVNTQSGGAFFSQAADLSNNGNRQYAFSVNSNGLQVYWTLDGLADNQHVFSATIPQNQWFHVAFSRASGVLRAYLDGTQVGTSLSHSHEYFNSTANVYVGSFGAYANNGFGYLDFAGYIDDLRITKAARYTGSSITVPTAAFPDP